jgi:hypothetical protein
MASKADASSIAAASLTAARADDTAVLGHYSAALAALLYLVYLQSGIGVLAAMVPILGMLLATLHYLFRQQEAAEAARAASAEAVERERELAARHVRELEASERRFHSAFTHASIGMALLAFINFPPPPAKTSCTSFGISRTMRTTIHTPFCPSKPPTCKTVRTGENLSSLPANGGGA